MKNMCFVVFLLLLFYDSSGIHLSQFLEFGKWFSPLPELDLIVAFRVTV